MAMITQAGVAMGLVKSCERRFASSWGGDFAALAAATIVLNLLAGPPAFRHAIVAAGESGAQRNASGAGREGFDRRRRDVRPPYLHLKTKGG